MVGCKKDSVFHLPVTVTLKSVHIFKQGTLIATNGGVRCLPEIPLPNQNSIAQKAVENSKILFYSSSSEWNSK